MHIARISFRLLARFIIPAVFFFGLAVQSFLYVISPVYTKISDAYIICDTRFSNTNCNFFSADIIESSQPFVLEKPEYWVKSDSLSSSIFSKSYRETVIAKFAQDYQFNAYLRDKELPTFTTYMIFGSIFFILALLLFFFNKIVLTQQNILVSVFTLGLNKNKRTSFTIPRNKLMEIAVFTFGEYEHMSIDLIKLKDIVVFLYKTESGRVEYEQIEVNLFPKTKSLVKKIIEQQPQVRVTFHDMQAQYSITQYCETFNASMSRDEIYEQLGLAS